MKTVIKKWDKLKIIKNMFLVYWAQDEVALAKTIYTKAASLLDGDKGFFLSSHRSQGEQHALVCAAQAGIDIEKYQQGKLLKGELDLLSKTMIKYFSVVESAVPAQIRREYPYDDISAYTPYTNYAFIEYLEVSSNADIAFIKELHRISKVLSIRIEVGVKCTQEWREKISNFASVSGV